MLATARFVERYHRVWLLVVKISRRIVESEMTIFANANEGNINGRLLQLTADRFHDPVGIGRTAEKVVFGDADFVDEAFA